MFSFKGIPVKIFATSMAAIAIVAGIWMTFFHSRGFVKTQGTIIEVVDTSTGADSPSYQPTVEYTVDGETYRGVLDTSSGSYSVGKVINVLYDPNDPTVVHDGGFIGFYFIFAGIAILARGQGAAGPKWQKRLFRVCPGPGKTVVFPDGCGQREGGASHRGRQSQRPLRGKDDKIHHDCAFWI